MRRVKQPEFAPVPFFLTVWCPRFGPFITSVFEGHSATIRSTAAPRGNHGNRGNAAIAWQRRHRVATAATEEKKGVCAAAVAPRTLAVRSKKKERRAEMARRSRF
jgi:hypothetical protein